MSSIRVILAITIFLLTLLFTQNTVLPLKFPFHVGICYAKVSCGSIGGTCAATCPANTTNDGPTYCGTVSGANCCVPITCNAHTNCTGWYYPYNTCANGNDYQYCTHTNSNCTTNSYYNYGTSNNCGSPGVCYPRTGANGAYCEPWCSIETCNPWTTPPNTCNKNNMSRTCTYTKTPGGGPCVRSRAPTQYKTINNCSGPHVCRNGKCIPWCSIISCGAWSIATNSCSNNNEHRTCNFTSIPGGGACISHSAPTEYRTVNTCSGPHVCRNGQCIPWCNVESCSPICDHIGVNTTCYANNAYRTCNYTSLSSGGACIPKAAANQACTLFTCTVPSWGCFGGTCQPVYTIRGNIFVDSNADTLKDNNENNFTLSPSMITVSEKYPPVSSVKPTVSIDQQTGTYTISNVISGDVYVSYTSLPTKYYMTTPLNSIPPTYVVHPGTPCSTNGAPGASCSNGNITNLNFGIINNVPWMQSVCGDIRNDSGFNNQEPAGQSAIITNGSCTTPGDIFTGSVDAQFGNGNASSTKQVVGGSQYPETYYTGEQNKTYTSYSALSAKAQSAGIMQTSLSTVCTIANCTLPGKLPHGIYTANGNVILNSYNFPVNQNYIFLINGNLTINGNINIPTSSTAIFATSGNIIVLSNVGSNANSPAPDLEGIFSAGKSFIINSSNICPDLRLNVQGEIIANAGQTGGTLVNNRNLCQFNAIDPTLQITKRLDFLFNLPEFVRVQQTISQEVAP